jgi:serine protease Do
MTKRYAITGVVVLALASFALGTATASTHVFAGTGIAPVVAHTVTQGYLGVDIRDITDDRAKVLKLKETRGAEICMIDHDGPAIKAGLREGDVILQMNGEQVEGEEQLRRMLRETPAGRTVSFVFSRDGQQQTISVQLADRDEVQRRAWDQHFAVPEPTAEDATIPDPMDDPDSAPVQVAPPSVGFGFGFAGPPTLSGTYTGAVLDALGPQLAEFFGAQPGTGLLIKSIDADSPAARAGLRAGDVVVRVNAQTVAARIDWLHAVQNSNGKPIAVTVLRNKHEQTLKMTAGAKKHSELRIAPPSWVLAHFHVYTVQRSEDWI